MNEDKEIIDGLYRKSVGILVLNKKKEIFIGKRLKGHNIKNPWQMPQGGIESGEKEEEAMRRELLEETGIKDIDILHKSDKYYYYNFPHEIRKNLWNGRYIGQKQRWFIIQFNGHDSEINIASYDKEFSEWKWENIENIIKQIVEFKKEVYKDIFNDFKIFLKN